MERGLQNTCLRVTAYGTVDELNSAVGMARLFAETKTDEKLAAIQNDLFDVGADLCRPNHDDDCREEFPPLRVLASQVVRLENEIDEFNAELQPLRSFILPGGSSLSAHLHLCRTVARRAERECVRLAESESVNPEAVRYLNRVSDWFFVAARQANAVHGDVLWVPGANR